MPFRRFWRSQHYIPILVALFAIIFLVSTRLLTPSLQAQELITVNPTPDTTYLTNPGIGWQQNNLSLPQMLPETVSYIDRSDVSWNLLNPADDVYSWTIIDNAIATAVQAGKQISFRVYTMRYGSQGSRVPAWAVTKGVVITTYGFPDYNNCVYQQEWSEFVDAVRVRYDGHPAIAYIDISGYGDFNEWSWLSEGPGEWTQWEDDYNAPETLDGHARRRLADMFIGGAQTISNCLDSLGVQQTVAYNYPGFQSTQLVMPYAGIRQSTWYVSERRANIGIRFDCLGSPSHDLWTKIGPTLAATWSTAPIVYEFCEGTSTGDTHYLLADTLMRQSHASIVRENFAPNLERDSAKTAALMLRAGYRYQLQSATFPATIAAEQQFTININWWNVGYAPAYPLMGHQFTAHIYLVNAQGENVADFPLQASVASWMPANNVLVGSTENPPDNNTSDSWTMPSIPAGTYNVRVGIVHNPSGRLINLAIAGRDAQGRYPLGDIVVESVVEPSPTYTPSNTPTATPTPTNTPTNTPTPTRTPIPSPTPIPIHVGDIDRSITNVNKTTWRTQVTIRVHRSNETNLQGVSVTGQWSIGGTTGLCVTNSNGVCTITSANLSKANTPQITFTVTNLTHSLAAYNSSANHDPDTGSNASNGTSITIVR